MTIKIVISGLLLHWLAGLGAFLWLNVVAMAAADAGRDPAGLDFAGIVVHFVLLQPLAHWLLASAPLAWWTWPGLAGLVLLLFFNSVLSVSILIGVYRLLGRPWHAGR